MFTSVTNTSPYGTANNLPISVADLKTRMRISTTSEDAFILECIKAATMMIEKYTGRYFVEQDVVLRIDGVNSGDDIPFDFIGTQSIIYLARPPIISVTSVKFFDDANVEITIDSANYFVDLQGGRIAPVEGYLWQTEQRELNAVEVAYKAGYVTDGNGATLPSDLIASVAMMAVYLYEHRMGECEIPKGAKMLAAPYKLMRVGVPYMGIDMNRKNTRSGSTYGGY